MRACISAPAPKMWRRRGRPTRTRAAGLRMRTWKKRCHGRSRVRTLPTLGMRRVGERGMLGFPVLLFHTASQHAQAAPDWQRPYLVLSGNHHSPQTPLTPSVRGAGACLSPLMPQHGALARLTHSSTGPAATWKPAEWAEFLRSHGGCHSQTWSNPGFSWNSHRYFLAGLTHVKHEKLAKKDHAQGLCVYSRHQINLSC